MHAECSTMLVLLLLIVLLIMHCFIEWDEEGREKDENKRNFVL